MINILVSEILEILLPYILSSAYFYLTELLLILIISPIILLIATLSSSIPNKTKIFILCFNMIYSLLLLYIPKLLLIILNYEKVILNNMYMTSYFSIFSSILTEIYRNIVLFIILYAIIVIVCFIMIIIAFRRMCLYKFKETRNFKEYFSKNKKFFIVASFISLISGFFLILLILTAYSSYYIHIFFLIILLIASILSYILLSNRKNIEDKSNSLSESTIEFISSWSSLLGLNFFGIKKSVEYIFGYYSIPYILITSVIIVITIFLLISIMSLYVYTVNTNRNLENMVKWIILGGSSISLLTISLIDVYLFVNRSIWYIIIGLSSFCIFMYLYCCIYSHILKNINKKNWDNILSRISILYAFSTDTIFIFVKKFVLYIAIGYVGLFIVYPYLVIKYINKNDDHDKNNLIPEK
ncbi:hypothetical protein Nps_00875 [Candidatus Nanopusillus acidilobi]|nr:hypothetical protein Nps_00875 [Candidatus Nanopusillus acidilobi]